MQRRSFTYERTQVPVCTTSLLTRVSADDDSFQVNKEVSFHNDIDENCNSSDMYEESIGSVVCIAGILRSGKLASDELLL